MTELRAISHMSNMERSYAVRAVVYSSSKGSSERWNCEQLSSRGQRRDPTPFLGEDGCRGFGGKRQRQGQAAGEGRSIQGPSGTENGRVRLTSIGSSVERVTLRPRRKNFGKGELRALRKRKWLEIGETESPTWSR